MRQFPVEIGVFAEAINDFFDVFDMCRAIRNDKTNKVPRSDFKGLFVIPEQRFPRRIVG
jgi:hypothetical protein